MLSYYTVSQLKEEIVVLCRISTLSSTMLQEVQSDTNDINDRMTFFIVFIAFNHCKQIVNKLSCGTIGALADKEVE